MSVHVMSWVLRHSESELGDRLVLIVLADHARGDGTSAWPSLETIARESRLSERQVRRCLRNLEASGEITETGRSRKGTHIYAFPKYGGDNMTPPGGTSAPEGGDMMTPEPSEVQPSLEPLAPAARERNETWDALSDLFGEATTRTSQTLRGKICRSLNEAGATPDEIRARAKRWPRLFPQAALTETALEKHWPLLQAPKKRQPAAMLVPAFPDPGPEQRAVIAAAARADLKQRRRSR